MANSKAHSNTKSNSKSNHNVAPSAPRPPSTAPQYVYEYQWPRIVAVSTLCLGLAGGAYYLFSGSESESIATNTDTHRPVDVPAQQTEPASNVRLIPANTIKPPPPGSFQIVTSSKGPTVLSIGMSAPEPAAATPTPEAKTLSSEKKNKEHVASKAEAATEPKAEQISVSKPAINSPEASLKTDSTPKTSNATESVSKAIIATKPATQQAAPTAAVERSQTAVFSKNIRRAKLTLSITDKEPGEAAPESIHLNEGELTKVFFFTEIIGQAGKTVTHLWYKDGKLKAKVRIPVGSDTWRSYSSKYLDDTMAGEWKVKAVDKKGNELARSEFNFSS